MRAPGFLRDAAGDDPRVRRIVLGLAFAVFVQWIGASAVLPLLPLYLRHNGTSPALVGAVMSAYFFAGVFTQYGAGHLTDRIGHRPVLVGALALYAVASLGFVAEVGAGGYVGLRALQGVGAGAVQVAAFALVATVVPEERAGRAFALVIGAQTAGMAVGPLGGGIAGVDQLRWVFIATAAASIFAGVPVLRSTRHIAGSAQRQDLPALNLTRSLIGIITASVSIGLIIGVYEACWSLLMRSRGASAWQIGLSWTLFCIPFAAMSPIAGRIVDRFDRRKIVAIGLLSSCAFAVSYPFISDVKLLLTLGVLESVGVACTFPAAQALLTQALEPGTLGRGQGLFTTAETAAIAVSAAAAGALFGEARWLPFLVGASAAAACVPVVLALTRQITTGSGPQPPAPEPVTAAAIPS